MFKAALLPFTGFVFLVSLSGGLIWEAAQQQSDDVDPMGYNKIFVAKALASCKTVSCLQGYQWAIEQAINDVEDCKHANEDFRRGCKDLVDEEMANRAAQEFLMP